MFQDRVLLRFGEASACIARHGAEPKSWAIEGQELIWNADPKFWPRSAPILFPVIGASKGGIIVVSGKNYSIPQHGFARDSAFDVIERGDNWAVLMLADSAATRMHFPFPFSLSVRYELSARSLRLDFEVGTLAPALPYQLGFHPAFAWRCRHDDSQLLFSSKAEQKILGLSKSGLLLRETIAAVERGSLPLSSPLIDHGALIFPESRSRWIRFTSKSGPHIEVSVEGFHHWAVWTKPHAPFLSIEPWAGLPGRADDDSELETRPAINVAYPQKSKRHSVVLTKYA